MPSLDASANPPSFWTAEDKTLLRTLKSHDKSRYPWKVIAGKLGKPEPEAKTMWKHIKDQAD